MVVSPRATASMMDRLLLCEAHMAMRNVRLAVAFQSQAKGQRRLVIKGQNGTEEMVLGIRGTERLGYILWDFAIARSLLLLDAHDSAFSRLSSLSLTKAQQ